ncbi:MAG: FAD-dependent oxidoreductase, partial [Hyphomicrobium sp.]|nr:FAD-dependent oxidoreductase [Hyphomicrobium sp.]
MQTAFDAIIIGTGQAGPALAARLSAAGMSVAIIERGRFGGTCVNTGCIPTKALVASAYAAHLARTAAAYGVATGPVVVDMARVKARKDAISGASSANVEKWLGGLPGCRVVRGHARFESASSVRVGNELLSAKNIYINVGGRALVPPIPGIDGLPFFTNASIMDVDFLPRHLVILGGSYIGLEFAQMYRRFGSEVSIMERGARLIAREDAAGSQGVLDIVRGEGGRVELGAEVTALARRGDEVVVNFVRDGVARQAIGSHLLLAIGRIPNTADLGLEKAGVAVDARGYITVDDALCSSVPNI